jgi:hypothetical protein
MVRTVRYYYDPYPNIGDPGATLAYFPAATARQSVISALSYGAGWYMRAIRTSGSGLAGQTRR